MLKALSDDAERQRLHLRDSRLGAVAVGQNARLLQYFGQPAAVVFSLGFDLEGDQVSTTSASIVRCPGGFREIQLTLGISRGRRPAGCMPKLAKRVHTSPIARTM